MSEKCDRCGEFFSHNKPHQHKSGKTICKFCWKNFKVRGINDSYFDMWLEELKKRGE